MKNVIDMLENPKMREQIQFVLPKGSDNIHRFIRCARTYLLEAGQNNPKMNSCDPRSIMAGVLKAASWGLEFGSGQVHLSPKGRSIQFTIGYQGFVSIMRTKLKMVSITVQEVHKNDNFHFEYGSKPHLQHWWKIGEDRGPVTAFYCFTKFPDSETWTIMTADELNEFEREHGGFMWKKSPLQMRKKTVLKQHCKYLGVEPELDRAFSNGDEQILDPEGKVTWPEEPTEPDKMRKAGTVIDANEAFCK